MTTETLQTLNQSTLIGFTAPEYGRGKAWHYRADLQGAESNHYDGAIPPEDVVRRLFDYEADEAPLEYTIPEQITPDGVTPARRVIDPTRKVVFHSKTGECMGVFTEDYARHQFRTWLLDGIATILDDDLGIGSAGVLMKGAVGWVQVEMPESVKLAGEVTFRPHLLAMTSHNGTRATGFSRVFTNVVCDNTLAMADNEDGPKIRYRHTSGSLLRIGEAREALGVVHTMTDQIGREITELLDTHVDGKQWEKFLGLYVPVARDASDRSKTMADNKRLGLDKLYRYDVRVAPWAGSGWGVMQAVNTYEQHEATARNLGEGNQGAARFGRSLMLASSGELTKQSTKVRSLLAALN